MISPTSARGALRAATAVHHDRVDAVFSRADLTDRTGYGRFLQAQAGAYLPVEAALERAGAANLVPDWSARRRAALLTADLTALGLSAPEEPIDIAFDDPAAVLGGIYVLEGSRLGGALLGRDVPADFPRAFLAPGDSAGWRRLLGILEHTLRSAGDIASAVSSASRVFLLFESSGRRYLEADCVGRI
jgi:heme oxygenase